MEKKKHIHLVKRHKYKNGESIYFCTLDDCSFKINVELSLGKRFICNRCYEPFIMTTISKRMSKPHCANCTRMNSDHPNYSPPTIEDLKLEEINSLTLPKEANINVTNLRDRLRKVESIKFGENQPEQDDNSDML